MPEIPLAEPSQTKIEEPSGSLEELESGAGPPDVARHYPTCLAAWAELGERAQSAGDDVTAYAFFRTGYHRGLDRLRASGWRGRGEAPWAHPGNRGFLRCLKGLGAAAAAIGETNEAQRCREFLSELAPDAP